MIENQHELIALSFNNQGGIYGNAVEYIDKLEEIVINNGLLREFISDQDNGFTDEDKDDFYKLVTSLSKVGRAIRRESY